MRILENVELPEAYADLFIKSMEAVAISGKELQGAEEDEKEEEEEEPSGKVDGTDDYHVEDEEDQLPEPQPEPQKLVRMANLCVVGSHAVTEVAEIHSEIVKDEVFSSFYKLWPEKFQNKTNRVTPRRWIRFCNPNLSKIIIEWLGIEDWVLSTEKLAELRKDMWLYLSEHEKFNDFGSESARVA